VPAEPESSPGASENQPRNGRDISRDEATIRALEGQPPEHTTLGAVRRQSTLSSRGDEYASDDEETEIVSATLISFDVEATESSDTPPGVWSAELRPNIVGDPRGLSREEPVYVDNALTRLPSVIATDILTVVSCYVLVAPYEAFALRLLARAFRRRYGLPVDDIHDLSPLRSLSWTTVTNFLGLEMIHLVIESECWSVMTLLAELYRGCGADWSFFRVLREKLGNSEG